MSNYTVKNIKSFIGREGHGFNASLYRDGKRIALVSDMADGGPVHFDWEDYTSDEAAKFEAYAATQPPLEPEGLNIPCDGDLYAIRLVEEFEFRKKLQTGLKKETYFIHNGVCYTNKAPYTPAIGTALAARYPGCDILNALPFDDAFKLFDATIP